MTTILTNSVAMAALQTLRATNRNLEETQDRISTGYRVETAADHAGYWSIATTMRSDNSALETVHDALGLGAAKVDTFYAAIDTVLDVMSEIKAKLVAADEPGVDKDKINSELTELKNQLVSAAQSASFSGENWLYNEAATAVGVKSVVASFNRSADGSISVSTLDYDTATSVLVDVQDASQGMLTKTVDADALQSTPTGTPREYYLVDAGSPPVGATEIALDDATTGAELTDMIRVADKLIQQLTDSAATLGAISTRIELQGGFVANLMDVTDKGVGRLVDADMNEESARLKARQTQQQLGIESLSIANTNSKNILRLFQQ